MRYNLFGLLPHRIRHQVGLVFALFMAIALFVLGYFLITRSEAAVKDSVLRDYREITIRTSREISTFIDKPMDLLVNTACMMGIVPYSDEETQKALVYRLITDYPELFKRVGFAGIGGKEIFSTEWDNPPKDYAMMEFFKELAATGKAVVSKVYFSKEGFPYLKVAVPVKQLDKITGFLVAQAKLNYIWQLVADIKTAGEDAFLVDEQGYVLVHNEEKKVYRGDNLKHLLSVRNVLEGKSGSLEESYLSAPMDIGTRAGRESRWLSAYAPVSPFGWGLVIQQPAAAAYAFSLRMQKTAGVIILLAILIAVLLSIMIARWITNPVKELAEMADKVASGDLEHIIKTSRKDEIGKLVKSFNEMSGKLKKARHAEKLSNIGTATAKIAHELRNPLVAVKAFMQLLPERHADGKFIREFNQTVPGEMARLEKMLAMMTDFSSNRKLALAECNIALLIKSTMDLLREKLAANNIRVDINTDSDNINIKVDADRIKQVLINLAQNAADAMPNKGELKISAKRLPEKILEIRIADTGCGMSPEEVANAFEPFYTSKRGGLGLGLTISREIIEQHKGTIELTSEKDRGTVFIIKLPLEN